MGEYATCVPPLWTFYLQIAPHKCKFLNTIIVFTGDFVSMPIDDLADGLRSSEILGKNNICTAHTY